MSAAVTSRECRAAFFCAKIAAWRGFLRFPGGFNSPPSRGGTLWFRA
nr:MAG TPA: hypothetical protein [Caudoviricetes sp.]